MKSFSKFLALGAVVAASASMAFADPMTMDGMLSIDGSAATTNSGITFASYMGTTLQGSAPGVDATGTFLNLFANQGQTDNVDLYNFTYNSVNTTGANGAGTKIFTVESQGTGGDLSYYLTNVSESLCFGGSDKCVLGNGYFLQDGFAKTAASFDLTTQADGKMDVTFSATTIAATPEPNSLLLMGTGLLGAAGMMFTRRRSISSEL